MNVMQRIGIKLIREVSMLDHQILDGLLNSDKSVAELQSRRERLLSVFLKINNTTRPKGGDTKEN